MSSAEGLGSLRVTPAKDLLRRSYSPPSGDSGTSPSNGFGKYRNYWGVPIVTGADQTWDDLVRDFKNYLADKKTQSLGFQNEEGEYRFGDYTHRFMEPYVKKQYAKMKAFERGSKQEYGTDLTTVLLTFTASTTDSDEKPRPPVEHMRDVLESWDYARYELRRSLNADREKDDREPVEDWEYLRILEPTTDEGDVMGGYTHVHVAVVCKGDVEAERFNSVIDKHVEKCPTAGESAHSYDRVIGVHDGQDIDNLGAYLFEYLGKSYTHGGSEEGDSEEEEPSCEEPNAYETAFDALLWHTEKRRFQPSEGAQRWMKKPPEDEGEEDWSFIGIVKDEHVEAFKDAGILFDDFDEFREHISRGCHTEDLGDYDDPEEFWGSESSLDDDSRPQSRHQKFRAIRADRSPMEFVIRNFRSYSLVGDDAPPPTPLSPWTSGDRPPD